MYIGIQYSMMQFSAITAVPIPKQSEHKISACVQSCISSTIYRLYFDVLDPILCCLYMVPVGSIKTAKSVKSIYSSHTDHTHLQSPQKQEDPWCYVLNFEDVKCWIWLICKPLLPSYILMKFYYTTTSSILILDISPLQNKLSLALFASE